MQSDFHTHAHDLPPQMGGCYENRQPQQQQFKQAVDSGIDHALPDALYPEPEGSRELALLAVLKHKQSIMEANPYREKGECRGGGQGRGKGKGERQVLSWQSLLLAAPIVCLSLQLTKRSTRPEATNTGKRIFGVASPGHVTLLSCMQCLHFLISAGPVLDAALRVALTMLTQQMEDEKSAKKPSDESREGSSSAAATGEEDLAFKSKEEATAAAVALRYIKDRVNVPRDMPLWYSFRHVYT